MRSPHSPAAPRKGRSPQQPPLCALRPFRFRPAVESLEDRVVPATYIVNPIPGGAVGDASNPGFYIELRKGPSGYISSSSDQIYTLDQLFTLDPSSATIYAQAVAINPPQGLYYNDNGAPAVPGDPTATPFTNANLTILKQTTATNGSTGVNSGTFNLPAGTTDNEIGLVATGYIYVTAAEATASQTTPWTFTSQSDDNTRFIIGASSTAASAGGGNTQAAIFTNCCGAQTASVSFSGPGYYPINFAWDQGGGGAYEMVYYNSNGLGGDNTTHVLGDTVHNVVAADQLLVYQNVITTPTAEPTGSVGINPGDLVTFTKSTTAISTLAQANAAAALPNGSPSIAARATNNGTATLNYLDTPVLTGGANGTYNGTLGLTNIGTPTDVATPPLTVVSGNFNGPSIEDDNFVMSASGFLQINPGQVGTWTFLVRASQGETLQIGPVGGPMQTVTFTDGAAWIYGTPVSSTTGGIVASQPGPTNNYGEVNFAAAGLYHFQLTWFQSTGKGASVQWLAKGPGQSNYALVGDTAANGNTLQVFQNEILPADVGVTMTGPSTVTPGNQITYTITVTNNGPGSATNVSLTDPLPIPTTFVSANGPPGWTLSTPPVGSGGNFTATFPTLAAGASGTFTLTVLVPVGTPASVLTNTATVSSTQPPNDINPGNNSATVTTTVVPIPPPPAIFATGADAGGSPQVNVYDAATNQLKFAFQAYTPSFRGGVRVAVGDVNGDGVPDIVTGAGPGGGPQVEVFDGNTGQLIRSFYALNGPSPFGVNQTGTAAVGNTGSVGMFTGGIFVAAGDVNGDGYADIIVGADAGGGPQVQVFDGKTGQLLSSFYAFAPGFTGGVRVAAGDVNGDGKDDIIVGAGAGGGPQVTVFNGTTLAPLASFYAYAPSFKGGVWVSAGDTNHDGKDDVITGAGPGGGPQVNVFDAASHQLVALFFATNPQFKSGVRVGSVTVNGTTEILTSLAPQSLPQLTAFDGTTLATLAQFFAYPPGFHGGFFLS